ncbi:MAG: response regulator transcription factor [Anaerolineae bacterium]|nr:response regulator transcription factor [Anaerolineae bacterium]
MLRMLIADDHRLFRQGLIGLMKTRRDLVEVVGEAATGTETLELAEQLQPDVVLLDLQMPDGDGFQTATFLRQFYPQIAVVILTASESDEDLYRAVQLGVSGYLLKSLDANELFDLLGSVAEGEMALTRAMASRLVRSIARHNGTTDANGSPMPALTERELDVLRLVAQGASNPQIADHLCITVNTVKVHLHNILEKLQLKNRAQVAAYAVSRGLTAAPSNLA